MLKEKTKSIVRAFIGAICVIGLPLLHPVLNTGRDLLPLQSRVDNYMENTIRDFSGAILIAQEGKVLVSKGYGMANYEHDVPNTPQTIFRIGSVTKQFTATAIMQLEERGLLSVDDDACIIILSNMLPVRTGEIAKDLAALLFEEETELSKDGSSTGGWDGL